MKKMLILFVLVAGYVGSVSAQTDIYLSGEWEFLFQGASIEDHGNKMNNNMRFTAFYHSASYINFDLWEWGGVATGLGIRNIGYIQDDVPDPDIDKIKRRSYTLGVPLIFKFGKMDGVFLFAGGEYEWAFHYKEKTFHGDVKSVYKDWFTNRTKHFLPSVVAGVQLPTGTALKMKYYLSNYLNEDYIDGNGQRPYQGMDVRMFYVSLSFVFRNDVLFRKITPHQQGVVVRR